MYTSFYKLSELPFTISTDTRFLWRGEKHEEALANLKYGLLEANGYVVLTGDVGTGKTTLVNALVENLEDNVIVANINHPTLETVEFFNLVAKSYDSSAEIRSKTEFLFFFKAFLQKSHDAGKIVLLVIDEAHCLSKELLEEIRLLSNLEHAGRKLVNIFFVGQNEFKETMLCREFRALRQRITLFYDIEPFSERETLQYISHRLKVAGAKNQMFSRAAIREIQNFTRGYPRLINILCGRSLLTGYVRDKKVIDEGIVKECVDEMRFLNPEVSVVPDKKEQRLPSRPAPVVVEKVKEPAVVFGDAHSPGSQRATADFKESSGVAPDSNNLSAGKNRYKAMPIVLVGFLGLGIYGAAHTMGIDLKSEAVAMLSRFDTFNRMKPYLKPEKTVPPGTPDSIAQPEIAVSQVVTKNAPEVSRNRPAEDPERQEAIKKEAPADIPSPADEQLPAKAVSDASSPPENVLPARFQLPEIPAAEPALPPQPTTLELASAALRSSNFQTAIDLLKAHRSKEGGEALKVKKTYAKALVGRAEQLAAASPVEAAVLLNQAVEEDPENGEAYFILGKIYTKSKEYSLAIDAYRKAGTIDPDMPDAFFNLGFIYATTGMYEDAEQLFLHVVDLEPEYLDKALFNLAVIQEKLGKKRECLENLQMAVQVNPANAKVQSYLQRFQKSAEEAYR